MKTKSETIRYKNIGKWYKGNTHIHSTDSDGAKEYQELTELYASAEYDFLFSTDHWVTSSDRKPGTASSLVWFNGIELDGRDERGVLFHVICLGTTEGITRELGLLDALELTRDQNSIQILAHPPWSGNELEDVRFWDFHGVEIYNHYCHEENGKGNGLPFWEALLAYNPNALGFCVDDSHFSPDQPQWNGGWIVVNAPELTEAAILGSIMRGNYYSSCGPSFYTIDFDGSKLNIKTSPVQFIRLVGPADLYQQVGPFNTFQPMEQSVEIPMDWDYIYIEIEDYEGRRAWSNTLFN